MRISNNTKGYFFALIATIAFANVYIFSKAALNLVALPVFGFYWFGIAFIAMLMINLKQKNFSFIPKKAIYPSIFIKLGILEIFTTTTFFYGISIIPDPAVTSFIGNMYVVFLILLGIVILKEKFTKLEFIGASITIIGAFTVGYQGGTSFTDFFIPGTGIVIINTLFAAYTSIIAKKTIQNYPPTLINLNRALFLFIYASIFVVFQKHTLIIPGLALKNIIIGTLLGPITAILGIYYSFKYIDASKSTVIQSLKGVFVLLSSFIYFSLLPQPHQLFGGALSIAGVLIMAISHLKRKKKQI